jgi:hypothetical protein
MKGGPGTHLENILAEIESDRDDVDLQLKIFWRP